MPKYIQLRNVPDKVHRHWKARAAASHVSLSDYLILELKRVDARAQFEQWCDRLATRAPVPGIDSAAAVRRERGPI